MSSAQSVIMKQAWKEWQTARRWGFDQLAWEDRWTWQRCLRFTAAQHHERQRSWSAVEKAARAIVQITAPKRRYGEGNRRM